jgi:hypothetical protein
MTDYLKRFDKMAKDLAAQDYIDLVEYKPQPPARKATLKSAEEVLGAPLVQPLRDFYEQTNGLKLHWTIKPNLSAAETSKLRKKSTDYYVLIAEYIEDPFAIINLLSLEDSILKKSKPGARQAGPAITFNSIRYQPSDFYKRLKPFDVMNRDVCMAFFLEKDNGNPPVLFLHEGCSDWPRSRPTDFGSYLEMLLATRGIVEAREKIFVSDGKDATKPLLGNEGYWQRVYTPKMFRKND